MVRIPFMLIVAAGWLVAAVLFPPRALFVFFAVICVIIWLAARSFARETAERARLLRDGKRGTARIRSMRQSQSQARTRGYLNVELELDVSTGGETWRVARREHVPELHVRRVAVDAVLPVCVDPNDSSRFLIDWDAAPGAAAG